MESEFVNELEDNWEEDGPDTDLDSNSFVCEDCDYRWEEASPEDVEPGAIVCPMCGSTNVTQL